MVAYNFNRAFHDDIIQLLKTGTIRGNRSRRHARPGEWVQLYAGMRTRWCRKLVTPDPICSRVDEIMIETQALAFFIEVNGIPIHKDELDEFARLDGFSGGLVCGPAEHMRRFWALNHGHGVFEGAHIHWNPAIRRPEVPLK